MPQADPSSCWCKKLWVPIVSDQGRYDFTDYGIQYESPSKGSYCIHPNLNPLDISFEIRDGTLRGEALASPSRLSVHLTGHKGDNKWYKSQTRA